MAQLEAKELAGVHLKLAQEQLRQLTVYAPFDGVVTELHAKLGTSVDSTLPIVSVANLDALEVELHAPVYLFGDIRSGKTVRLRAGAPVNRTLDAEVRFTSPIVNSASNTFRCVLRIDNRLEKLPAGFSVVLE